MGGGGGQEDISEPEKFFCIFLEQENFFRRPFGPDYFFQNLPELFSLNRGGGTHMFFIYQNFSFFPEILPSFL